jgi:hypothetical protein
MQNQCSVADCGFVSAAEVERTLVPLVERMRDVEDREMVKQALVELRAIRREEQDEQPRRDALTAFVEYRPGMWHGRW